MEAYGKKSFPRPVHETLLREPVSKASSKISLEGFSHFGVCHGGKQEKIKHDCALLVRATLKL